MDKENMNNISDTDNMEYDEMDNIIVLIDENNQEVQFEYLDTIEYQDDEYVVLAPVEDEDSEELNVVIFKIEHHDEGDSFVVVEDQDKLDAVFNIFKERYNALLDEME